MAKTFFFETLTKNGTSAKIQKSDTYEKLLKKEKIPYNKRFSIVGKEFPDGLTLTYKPMHHNPSKEIKPNRPIIIFEFNEKEEKPKMDKLQRLTKTLMKNEGLDSVEASIIAESILSIKEADMAKLQTISKELVKAGMDSIEANKIAGKILLGGSTLEKELQKLKKGESMKKETKKTKKAKVEKPAAKPKKAKKAKTEKPIEKPKPKKSKKEKVVAKVQEVRESIKEIAKELDEVQEIKPKEPKTFKEIENYFLELGMDKIKASNLTTKVIEGKVNRSLVVFDFLSGKTENSPWERKPGGEKPIVPDTVKKTTSAKAKTKKSAKKEKPVKVEKVKKAKKEKAKPVKKEGKPKKLVTGTIREILAKKGPITKDRILEILIKEFPEKRPTALAGTLAVQVPSRISKEYKKVLKDDKGRYYFKK